MTFVYEVEDEDGNVLVRYEVEATFSDEELGFFSGRPERCRPDSGGELEDVTVYLGNKDVTQHITDELYFQIRDHAKGLRR